jgi:hypothetical protein
MKLQWVLGVLGIALLANQLYAEETLKSQKEKMSYIIGMDIGKNLKNQSIDVDANVLAKGVKDALTGGKSLLTDQ